MDKHIGTWIGHTHNWQYNSLREMQADLDYNWNEFGWGIGSEDGSTLYAAYLEIMENTIDSIVSSNEHAIVDKHKVSVYDYITDADDVLYHNTWLS